MIVRLLIVLCLLISSSDVFAQKKKVVGNDVSIILPAIQSEINTFWPNIPRREFPMGIVAQESLLRVNAKLKTHREFGCGIGQFTIAYNANGTVRFDALEETKRLDKSLANWTWEDCYNLTYQARGVILKLKSQHRDCSLVMANSDEALKCNAGKYNGGAGSVAKRIRSCRVTPNCNPKIWENNLALQCPQSKTKVEGYGESFCEINSKYPGRVFTRMKAFEGKL